MPVKPTSNISGRRASGFTIVEVMIVVIVVAIVSALALPLLSGTDNARLASAARLLMADVAFAQAESIAHADDPCIIVFDQANSSYVIARTSAPSTPITNPADGKPYSTQFGVGRAAELAGVTIQGYSLGGDDKLGFGAYGQLDQASAASVTFQSGGVTLSVSIDPDNGETSVGAFGAVPASGFERGPGRRPFHQRYRSLYASNEAFGSAPTAG